MNRKKKMKAALDQLFQPAGQSSATALSEEEVGLAVDSTALEAAPAPVVEAAPAQAEAPAPTREVQAAPALALVEETVVSAATVAPTAAPAAAAPAPAKPAPRPQPAGENASGLGIVAERQLVVFRLAGEHFGLEIAAVDGIIKMQAITQVPHVQSYIRGVTNLRGTVLPVIDLRTRFGLPGQAATKDSRIIVLKNNGAAVGVIVDSVSEVLRVPEGSVEPAPQIAMTVASDYIEGLARAEDRIIVLLNLDRVLKVR